MFMITLAQTWVPKAPPLREDPPGTVRVGKSRVTLDVMLNAYNQGMSAEEIAAAFDTLKIADIHAVLSYYLQNREVVDAFLKERQDQADEARRSAESEPRYIELRKKVAHWKQRVRESK
jgi:uncharacterized protein (DUF433 family)